MLEGRFEPGRLVGLQERVVGQEGLDLLADPLGDHPVVVEQGEPAERPPEFAPDDREAQERFDQAVAQARGLVASWN